MVKIVCQSFVIVICKSYSPAFVNSILKHSSSVEESESGNEEVNKSQIFVVPYKDCYQGKQQNIQNKFSLFGFSSLL